LLDRQFSGHENSWSDHDKHPSPRRSGSFACGGDDKLRRSFAADKRAQSQGNVDVQALAAQTLIDARTAVENSLRDPSSAEFNAMTIAYLKGDQFDFPYYVCGNVNAKNDFGGYGGQRSFIVYILVPRLSGHSPIVDWRSTKDLWSKCGTTIDAKDEIMKAAQKSAQSHKHKIARKSQTQTAVN
jgi:hypothetical protein